VNSVLGASKSAGGGFGTTFAASGPPELFAAVFVPGGVFALEEVFEIGGPNFETGDANFDAVCTVLGGAGGDAFGSTFSVALDLADDSITFATILKPARTGPTSAC
jgi:hypothetical protein